MYTRVVRFKNKDGSLREYLYLLESRKINGKVKQILLANLGRLEIVGPKLSSLIEHLSKHIKEVEVIKLSQDLFGRIKDLFNQEVDMILLDTTSISYWGEGKAADEFLDYGYAKNKRFDLKQVILGIMMTKEGFPIGHEVYRGNTNDVKAFERMLESIRKKFKIRKVIIVCDRGMVSEKNLSLLEGAGYEYIVGVRMKQLKEEEANKFLSTEGMEKVSDDLKAKEIIINGKRKIICFNSQQAELDKEKRISIIERLREKLRNQGLKSILIHREYSKYLKIKADKPILDKERIEKEKIFDGKFVLQTNTKLSWKEIVLSYKDLWQIEAAFKTLKNKLEVGPIFHHKEERIRAHIFICFLDLVLRVVLEKRIKVLDSNVSVTDVIEDLRQLKAVKITLKGKEIVLRTEFRQTNNLAFKALSIRPPSRIISSQFPQEQKVVIRG